MTWCWHDVWVQLSLASWCKLTMVGSDGMMCELQLNWVHTPGHPFLFPESVSLQGRESRSKTWPRLCKMTFRSSWKPGYLSQMWSGVPCGKKSREDCFCHQLRSRSKVNNEASHYRQNHAASRLALRHSYFPTFLITQSPKHQISMSIMPQEVWIAPVLWQAGGWVSQVLLRCHCFNELSRPQRLSSC